jgi:hypothetical protein
LDGDLEKTALLDHRSALDDGTTWYRSITQSVGLLAQGNIAVMSRATTTGLLILGPNGKLHHLRQPARSVAQWISFIHHGDRLYMFVQPDGKILLVGNRSDNPAAFFIARLRPKSVVIGGYELDPSFSSDGKAQVTITSGWDTARAVALFGSKIIVSGHSNYNNYYDFSLAVLENDLEYYPPSLAIEHKLFLPMTIR